MVACDESAEAQASSARYQAVLSVDYVWKLLVREGRQ